ncbi:hypothetical protein [Microbulbifer taiwanensis]|uniref:Uncharacterized protein n=1 Tax=Microbulbifer taiwanensis TaxID=986746 RepID=A0ABW1YV66_9GAMM|nr:hypothetical protein [Microbulbifer taiwanensis]
MAKITRLPWPHRQALAALGSTLSDEVECDLCTGHAQLYMISGEASGYFVTRIENLEIGGRELVICAGTGAGLVGALEAIGRGALGKFDSLRCHCSDWRIEALYQRAGLEFSETVYRLNLNGREE